ncbi:MAG: FAD-dependent monooxygenase [Candidatus Melainabacteria bacterium]|nr:FAD-dependent monooxygenase [Candidatus Melainabacteria bacterium]
MSRRAIIVGAGIGGLAAGIALRAVGVDVEIFEQSEELREVGAGITLYGNALKALARIGLDRVVVEHGAFARSGRYTTSSGRVLTRFDEQHSRELEMLGIHRGDLLDCLATRFGKDAIKLGRKLVEYKQDESEVVAVFEDGSIARGNLLIGADGLYSAVARQMHGDAAPRYSGSFAWRGVSELAHMEMPFGSGLISFGRGLQFGAVHIGGGRIYWFGAVQDPEGHGGRTGIKDVLSIFGDWHEPIAALIESTPEAELLTHDLYDRDPRPFWASGRVALLGDAAHPMVPYMGQGGCQALEDAVFLAFALKFEARPDVALGLYEFERRTRADSFVARSRSAQTWTMTSTSPACLLRDLGLFLMPRSVLLKQFHTLSSYHLPDLT